ncbi:HDOD domain-containing protein [Dechloromonas sp. ARDL1]|uniref:HDOD domain-containing protein n=1 Tax=Dechloromonas sp. ARDL1 TaxID=3322121 RepID=UPI003DA70369
MTEPRVEERQNKPAADAVESRMKIELRDIGIPPRPLILTQIEQETAKDDPDFIYLAKLLGQDVALSAGVIKIANSPFFSFGKKVPTVQEALLVLGLKQVLRTIAGLSLQQVFKHVPNMDRFWDASATTANVSAMLVRQIGNGIGIRPEDAHTFALFRDCGIPMLMIPFPEYRDILIKANHEETASFTAVEEEAIGLNHAALGAQLAEDWLLPEETCQAIRHHHDRSALEGELALTERTRHLIAVAQLAEYLIQQKTSQSQTCEWVKLGDACLHCLNLGQEQLPELARTCVPEAAG